MKTSEQQVELLSIMGGDLSIVNAARVSFHKESKEFSEQDAKLLKYLAAHGHWTPFAHTSLSFRIKAPIFVARQLGKHQVGLVWNEVSRRYVDEEPEFYIPKEWRGKPVNAKQGSSAEVITALITPNLSGWYNVKTACEEVCQEVLALYLDMIESGVAPEQARMVLPQNTMTEWIWTGSLAAFARVCNLRLDPHAQLETQEIAKLISSKASTHYKHSWSALMENN